MELSKRVAVARGDAPADLVLCNGRMLNLFSAQIESADIALAGDHVAGIGPGYRAQAAARLDLEGAYVAPGLIDAHVHIESSLCLPGQFAAALLPRGVTSAVVDPHEVANVAGVAGIRFMADSCRDLPLHVLVMASSCVPATTMETNGATLAAADLAPLLADGTLHGLAEVMNFPGVIAAQPDLMAKLALFAGHPVDGHGPGLSGARLNAYLAAGVGSDHECTTVAEAAEKLARGMMILIREATAAHNLQALLPLITPANSRRICFCTDDRTPGDLLELGSVDQMVRAAIAYGIDPITAWQMASLNTAEWFGLRDRGAIAPGRLADLVIFDDLHTPTARLVFSGGRQVAADGVLLPGQLPHPQPLPPALGASVNVRWAAVDLRVPARGRQVRVIGAQPNQLVTEERIITLPAVEGLIEADPARDILKIAVIERHHASGGVGLGFIQGFGLRQGAIAGTVAHDHHNLVVIGADDRAMLMAARAVADLGGGLAAVGPEGVMARLPLPVAGLMSDRPIAQVAAAYAQLCQAAARLGSTLADPFMAMSFMALEVIPKLKLTDQGLIDVEAFAPVDLFADS